MNERTRRVITLQHDREHGQKLKGERGERLGSSEHEQLVSALPSSSIPPSLAPPLLALHMKQSPPRPPPLKPFPRYHHFCQSGKSFFRVVSSPRAHASISRLKMALPSTGSAAYESNPIGASAREFSDMYFHSYKSPSLPVHASSYNPPPHRFFFIPPFTTLFATPMAVIAISNIASLTRDHARGK